MGGLHNGDRPSGKEIATHIRRAVRALPIGIQTVYARADSGFYCGEAIQAYREMHCQFIVESPFDMVRLRTNAARRYKRVEKATSMIWKLLRVAEKAWRHLKGSELLQEVYDGQRFADGVRIVRRSKAAA